MKMELKLRINEKERHRIAITKHTRKDLRISGEMR